MIDAQINYTRIVATQKSLKRAVSLKSALKKARKVARKEITTKSNVIDTNANDVEMKEIIEPDTHGNFLP